jgi:NADH-quinone oxidoreductase subunit F
VEKPLTGDFRPDGRALTLEEYRKAGGYEALKKALREMSPADVARTVKDAGLRGRGGAGFSTGLKWEFMPAPGEARHPRYLVCNADEMEPGTFKDRVLLEGNPHQLIEGMLISSFAIGADVGYIFLRWAYHEARRRLERALEEAYNANLLGRNVLGTEHCFELHLHTSAGRYMCGEETTMITAIEGRRPFPRAKPPHLQVSGLWGRPTIANNAETLCNVPHIVKNGASWYRGLSRSGDGGTKVYAASGRVKRPGAWELPMGTAIREIIEEHAGGMREGYRLRAVIPGGASTEFVLERDLDIPMDFDSLRRVGSRMGTGTMIVLDDRTCPVGVLLSLQRFFARESCGWCTPCREGLPWVEKTLEAIEEGRGEPEDLDVLSSHARLLAPGSTYCLLAPGAMEPLGSGLAYFGDDFQRHIDEGRCPWAGGSET